jgi:hypothetical protein
MKLTDEQVKNRFAAACQQYDIENATSNVVLTSVVSMHNSGVEKYRDIPADVIKMITRLLDHNRAILKILFQGEKEIDFDKYIADKIAYQEEFMAILKSFPQPSKQD